MQARSHGSHWPLTILMGASSVLNLFLPLLLVRLLSPEQVGQYKLFFLYVTTAPWLLFSSGFANGMYFWLGQKNSHQAIQATWRWQILWLVGVLFSLLGLFFIGTEFTHSIFDDHKLVSLMIFSIAFLIPTSTYEDYLIGHGQTKKAAVYGASWELLKTISMIIVAFNFRTILAITFTYTALQILKVIISALLLGGLDIRFHWKPNSTSAAVFKYAVPSSAAAALAVVLSYCDQFILGRSLSSEEFAAYSLGCLSLPFLSIFEQSVNKVAIPKLSARIQDFSVEAISIYRKTVIELGTWLIPSVFGLYFFAGPLTRMLFTDRYPMAEVYLKLYCFYYLSFVFPFDTWARALGRSSWVLKTTAIFASVSLTLTWFGLQLYGAIGALIGFLIGQFLLRIYSIIAMKFQLKWSIRQFIPIKILILTTMSSVTIGFLTSYFLIYFKNEKIGFIFLGVLFWLIYIGLVIPMISSKLRKESKSRKILMLTQFLNIGGLEKMILNLSSELKTINKWQPSVLVYDQLPSAEVFDKAFADIPVIRWQKSNGFSLKLAWQIMRYTQQNQIDQIHAHDLGPLIYAVIAKFLSLGRIKVIFTQHSFVHLKKKQRYSFYESLFPRLADEVIVVSESLMKKYESIGLPAKKINLIENGIPFLTDAISAENKKTLKKQLLFDFDENKFWVLSVARLHPGKGQEESLTIWSYLPSDIQQKSLLIFLGSETSSGYKNQLIHLSEKLNCQNVIFAGSSFKPDQWMRAADLFISASQEEGLPLTPLEALACQLPVFLSDIPGHKIFSDRAEFFQLQDLPAATVQLQKLIDKRHVLNKDLDHLKEKYSAERMAADYMKVYEKF